MPVGLVRSHDLKATWTAWEAAGAHAGLWPKPRALAHRVIHVPCPQPPGSASVSSCLGLLCWGLLDGVTQHVCYPVVKLQPRLLKVGPRAGR